jgi:hypothetical protein
MMEREFALAGAFVLAVTFCAGSPEPTRAQGVVLIARGSAQRPAPATQSGETGTLGGRVVDLTTGEPIGNALVQAGGSDQVATYTAADGSFVFARLPVGEYDLVAAHSGYITDFGYARAGGPSRTSTRVTRNQRADVTIRMMRAAVIGGQVIDANGEPVPDAVVAAGRMRFTRGQRRLMPTGGRMMPFVVTDDEGHFRIGGLVPGRYYAWVSGTAEPVGGRFQDQVPTLPITSFAPGVPELSAASSIELGPGERRLDVTIVQLRGRAFTVSGSVVSDASSPAQFVNLMTAGSDTEEFGMPSRGAGIDAHGAFSFPNVPEGHYRVNVVGRDGQPLASSAVDVNGADVSGLVLRSSSVVTLHGRFVTEDGQLIPMPLGADRTAMGLSCSVETAAHNGGRQCTAKPDGSFEIFGIGAGYYRLTSYVPPNSYVRQVLFGTTDVTDALLDVRPDGRDDLLTIVVTKKTTGVGGVVTDTLGRPQGGAVVAVFSTTPGRWWLESSRYVVAIGTQRNGSFEYHGLPPGEYYVAVASGYPEWPLDTPELDPDFLDQLRSGATVVNLVDGETRTVSLAIRQ